MSSKKTKLLESAQKNFLKGQYDRAVMEYRQLIQLDPADIRHRQRLAEILTKANLKEEAISEYSFLAKHYVETVHYLKAIAVYKQIQKLDPSNPDTSITLASLNEKQGLIGNAASEYAAAVQIYEKNGENLKALKTLESMLALDTANTAVRLRIAEKYYSVGTEDKSFNAFISLLKDLKERDDENGFRFIAEKAADLFPNRVDEIDSVLSDSSDNGTDLQTSSDQPALSVNTAPVEHFSSNDALPMDEPLHDFSQVAPLLEEDVILDDELELIDDIMPLEDDSAEELSPFPDDSEWEEEIDLVGIHTEQSDDHPVDTIDLSLDELELEIEIDNEATESFSDLTLSQPETDLFDLGKELSIFADDIDFDIFKESSTDSSFNLNSSGFKKNELETEDSESHYSLGLAYKEMGLFDEAIAEFIVASRSSQRKIDAQTLQGVCFREIGNIPKAIEILSDTAGENNVTEDEYLGIKYELAICHEASGDTDSTRKLFEEIIATRPDFSDVALRLRVLQE